MDDRPRLEKNRMMAHFWRRQSDDLLILRRLAAARESSRTCFGADDFHADEFDLVGGKTWGSNRNWSERNPVVRPAAATVQVIAILVLINGHDLQARHVVGSVYIYHSALGFVFVERNLTDPTIQLIQP